MKRIFILLLAFFCLLIIGGCTSKNIPTEKIKQSYEEKNGYYYYDNIPRGIKYKKPGQELDFKTKTDLDNISTFMTRNDSNFLAGDYSNYVCKATNKEPIIIDLFYRVCSSGKKDGCAGGRRAILCGDQYLIEQINSAIGPILYGPFKF